ncbi:gamma-glutamyl hydrolase-like isoform X3 [Aethina tumida]|uniref:gamma-glutamyl hydrolase-like isoform X3 n=1 Tax=Aethina tumida TaxID=116153 RepID=UPI0021499958|nr:gamma-glutamyl hydrolase-like isoform X3 [Aethina tumida]
MRIRKKLISMLNAFDINKNDTPIIGILSQETYSVRKYLEDDAVSSFIAASYVKYVESAGGRVVPIWIGQREEYYQRVVNYTNGIIFPGGATYFNETAGYGEAAKILYRLAVKANKEGIYYPIWGTCLGMEVFAFAILGEDIRVDCDLHKVAIPLEFSNGYEKSKLMGNASDDVIHNLKNDNVTYNQHRYCLTESVMKENNLLNDWKILATNLDNNKLEFISMMESIKYPFYGVQFHPEKNQFEFKQNVGIPHTPEAIKISQYFGNFFVNECRQNGNAFPDHNLEQRSLIYNYSPVYTGIKNSAYEQIYQFTNNDFVNNQLE